MQVIYVSQKQMKTLDPHPEVPVISFVEPEDTYFPEGTWLEVLQIKCHDITRETPPYSLFNKEQARQIVDFVDKHKYPPLGYNCALPSGSFPVRGYRTLYSKLSQVFEST